VLETLESLFSPTVEEAFFVFMVHPLLCVTVTADTTAELRVRRDEASRHADLVELRLDGLRDIDVAGALAGRTVPVIVTCRPRREGGAFDGAEEARLGFLGEAVRLGADYVDVEWSAAFAPVLDRRGGRGIVLSAHVFDGVPADVAGRWRAMRASGAEVVKLAVMAHSLSDTLRLMDLGARVDEGGTVVVAMGMPGLPSRLLAGRFGSRWTYAGESVAPGQLPASRMLDEFRFRKIGPATRIYGVVGRPIGHSLSPAIHNAAFDATGEDAVLLPLEAASADDFRRFSAALGVSGAAVTAPFKQSLADGADVEADDPASRLVAVNTLKRSGARWVARNTDVPGFLSALDARAIPLEGCRAAVVGAGGAARAVAFALAQRGARVTVHGRRAESAERAAAVAPGAVGTGAPIRAAAWDLLVNATPVGTWPEVDATPVPAPALAGGGVVYDLVYNPARTRLMAEAAAAGCRVIGGLDMLVEQAARQFEWWTGRAAPRAAMREAAARRLTSTADRAGDR
jgi:3-dehydroquinate dehydratase/shikimate dehydrogenase